MAVGALGPSLFMRDYAMGHTACRVTSLLAIFVHVIVFESLLNARSHFQSLVS
jgi:hypothetical protein